MIRVIVALERIIVNGFNCAIIICLYARVLDENLIIPQIMLNVTEFESNLALLNKTELKYS
jgi:hypothetical protein